MNNSSDVSISIALRNFTDKLTYFYAFNVAFCIWAILSLAYYIYNTFEVTCNEMQLYFIAWTCSYALQVVIPINCIGAVRQGKYYTSSFVSVVAGIIYKIIVILSLLIGAWNHVGLCFIPQTFKLIIIITNSLQALCLIVLFALVWRIKAVNRQILIEKLIMTKTFAQA